MKDKQAADAHRVLDTHHLNQSNFLFQAKYLFAAVLIVIRLSEEDCIKSDINLMFKS